MGFFSNLNIEQETDLEYPAVHQAEEAALKAEPAYTSPSVEPADGVKAVSVAAGAPKADETGNTQPAQQTEEEKRKAHEAVEEKRKAEWEERQRLRREKEQIEWEKAVALDNNALIAASVKRLGDATERLTRRNMKLCVTEYVQTLCYEDMEFARLAMHPRKSMVNCFHRINRKAREYLEKEMKDNDEQPENGAFGGDVPDGICYQWAEEYFRDLDAEEDKTDADKEFTPRPYHGVSSVPKKKAEKKKPQPAKKEPPKGPEQLSMTNQITLDSFLQPEKKAG